MTWPWRGPGVPAAAGTGLQLAPSNSQLSANSPVDEEPPISTVFARLLSKAIACAARPPGPFPLTGIQLTPFQSQVSASGPPAPPLEPPNMTTRPIRLSYAIA